MAAFPTRFLKEFECHQQDFSRESWKTPQKREALILLDATI